jgi:hypothetical protein
MFVLFALTPRQALYHHDQAFFTDAQALAIDDIHLIMHHF